MRDKQPQVRARAAAALTALGPKAQPALPALLKVLEDEDPQVRLLAALVIARIERQKAEHIRLTKKIREEVLTQLGVIPAIKAQQQRAAMSDPILQRQFLQLVLLYSLTSTGASPPREISGLFNRLGPEAVPAVVAGINFVAANQIGRC